MKKHRCPAKKRNGKKKQKSLSPMKSFVRDRVRADEKIFSLEKLPVKKQETLEAFIDAGFSGSPEWERKCIK